MATEAFGLPFEVGTLSAWLVWILPFAAAMIIPGVGKLSKHATGYVAVAFALMSALSAATMIPVALEAHEMHHQIMWIEAIGLKGWCLSRSTFNNNGKCCRLDFIPHYDLQYRIHERR